ncbi:MAG: sulfurtransferase TusA family protein [Candidatus Lokiarchaeota archaeon]|nr:sulfurtransferase TusA family protein [Candidatus Lokiarchaeota archaeon]
MAEKNVDITGEVCPYCVLIVRKELQKLHSGDKLVVKCDHPPAANENIPTFLKSEGHTYDKVLLEPGVWQFSIVKK